MNEAMFVADLLQRIPLGPGHGQASLLWCQQHVGAEMGFWRRVLWTDESRFALDFNDAPLRVRRLQT